MVERAADRARRAVDQGGRELGAHAVDARQAQSRRFLEELDGFYFRGQVRFRLTTGLSPGLDQGGGVVRGPPVPVGLGPDGGQFLAGLTGLVTLAAQLGTPLLPGTDFFPGGIDLGGQRGPGLARPARGPVLVLRLLAQGPHRLPPPAPRHAFLPSFTELGGAGHGRSPGLGPAFPPPRPPPPPSPGPPPVP